MPDPAPIRGRWTLGVTQDGQAWMWRDCSPGTEPDPVPIRGRWTITQRRPMVPRAVSEWHVATGPDPGRHGRVEVVPVPDEAAIERGAQAVEDHRFPRVGWDAETDTYGVWFYREASDRTLVRVVTGYGSVAAAAQAVNGLVAEAVLRAALEPPA
jgi:hypothetical protein